MTRTPAKKLRGLYLVVDTTIPEEQLLPIVQQALEGGVDILQLWGNTKNAEGLKSVGKKIYLMAQQYYALCLIADNIDVCRAIDADGIHFDGYEIPPLTPHAVKKMLGKEKIVGVTCGNNIGKLHWAQENDADYVSFCSIFPSSSVDTCQIVPLDMIRTAKRMLRIPIFASGGITVENIHSILEAGADGVAIISAILKASDPRFAARSFKEKLETFVGIQSG